MKLLLLLVSLFFLIDAPQVEGFAISEKALNQDSVQSFIAIHKLNNKSSPYRFNFDLNVNSFRSLQRQSRSYSRLLFNKYNFIFSKLTYSPLWGPLSLATPPPLKSFSQS